MPVDRHFLRRSRNVRAARTVLEVRGFPDCDRLEYVLLSKKRATRRNASGASARSVMAHKSASDDA